MIENLFDVSTVLSVSNVAVFLFVLIGGVLISLSVHFIPIGGAPAAMAQATGVGTGTTQLAAGAGLTGLLAAGSVSAVTNNLYLPLFIGSISSCLMIAITMFSANLVYIFGVGCPLVSGKRQRDVITKDRQDVYVSKGTEGHGTPTASFFSGLIGGLIGGFGGSLTYVSILYLCTKTVGISFAGSAAFAATCSIALFYINSVIASYNIGGTIEGFTDQKFKKLPKAIFVSSIASAIFGIITIATVYLFIVPATGGIF